MVNRVLVTGAGFTHAFFSKAPLIEDDYYSAELVKRFKGFPQAQDLVKAEQRRLGRGFINIERLMSRLDMGMPYDRNRRVDEQLRLLLVELKNCFKRRMDEARKRPKHGSTLLELAKHCLSNEIKCITFNYDDTLDEALFLSRQSAIPKGMWSPQWGYGFPMRKAGDEVSLPLIDHGNYILKLHGSMNWRTKLGSRRPFELESLVHLEGWGEEETGAPPRDIESTLDPEPFMVPPVLVKAELVQEPVLRLVWTKARNILEKADEVYFVGYSLPPTDIAASFLFSESLNRPRPPRVKVVNWTSTGGENRSVKDAFKKVLPFVPPKQFWWDGAVSWAKEFCAQS